jgi:hypothetical protein
MPDAPNQLDDLAHVMASTHFLVKVSRMLEEAWSIRDELWNT